MKKRTWWVRGFFIILMLGCIANVEAKEAISDLKNIPVQSQGRMKPFETFAKESVVQITGKSRIEGLSATNVIWDWIVQPEVWMNKPMIPVKYKPLREDFGVMLIDGNASPEILLNHKPFVEAVQVAAEKQRRGETLPREDKERLSLYNKANLFQAIGAGQEPGWIPVPGQAKQGWLTLESFATPDGYEKLTAYYEVSKLTEFREAVSAFIQDYRANSQSETLEIAAAKMQQTLSALLESSGVHLDQKILRQEKIYNALQPFSWAWKLYLLAFLSLLVVAKIKASKKLLLVCLMILGAGFILHTYGFYLRCVISGRPPVSNMYESIIWVSWAVVLFSGILYAFYRSWLVLTSGAFVAFASLILAQGFPVVLNPAISPLVPVLRSNLWLTVHVLTITLSYGAFALAWGIGHVATVGYVYFPAKRERNRMMAQYVYRAMQIGVILLAVGTVLGGVWANYSWGRFWGWDPKETWALIALLGYLAVLHGRFAGWLGPFGLAAGAILAFAGVVMAWYGVNFVLAAGLHSYGFGGGGAPYVFAVVGCDLALASWWIYKFRQNQGTGAKATS